MAVFSKPGFRPEGVFLNISRSSITGSGLIQQSAITARKSTKNRGKLLNCVSIKAGEDHAAALTEDQNIYRKALDDILYYLKRNMIAYHSHRKKTLRKLALGEMRC